jgi:radical SAM superfamily enzyme YgiQ (UPF0313 family)
MRALLVHPAFSPLGFWNYTEVCKLVGAKYPASPLGLVTVAALLPESWELRLVDMNTRPLRDDEIDWADLVLIGGMLPQQNEFLKLIDRAHAHGKRVVAGGPAPTSQQHIYEGADYLVLGEAECTLPAFLEDYSNGAESGVYTASERPDMSATRVPRFDLLDFNDYLMVGIQFSRGCPFDCEFCDIIELYGRRPRVKTPAQVLAELQTLYDLGYRGHIDLVDDNFIGHERRAKDLLRELLKWSRARGYPFYFSTEASLNLADDEEMMSLMSALDFRYVFIGIESPDNEVLRSTQKRVNLNRDIVGDLHKIYAHGIVVNGGFIVGFDNETSQSAPMMIDLVTDGKICMAMVGLLYALPNTQLARRLEREGRLLNDAGGQAELSSTDVDQSSSGINFVPVRPQEDVISDYVAILQTIYATRNYFNRCLQVSLALRVSPKHRPPLRTLLKYGVAFLGTVRKLGLRRGTAFYYWRNVLLTLVRRPSSLETIVNLMAMYIHFEKQAAFIARLMDDRLKKHVAVRGAIAQERSMSPEPVTST